MVQRAIAEPAVALTDALIAIESTVAAYRIAHTVSARRSLRTPFVAFFAATAAASMSGAILHGMAADRSDGRRRGLWRLSLASIGGAALSAWSLAARLGRPGRHHGPELVAAAAHVPYLIVVTSRDVPYIVAVAGYVPAALALGGVLAARVGDPVDGPPARFALAGLGVTFVAAGVQVRGIGLGPRFDHNALYHTLQAAGLGLLYRSAAGFLRGA
jgi:hypothetical protein